MSDLPEIPDEAVRAAADEYDCHPQVAREGLEAAWPHLYATALRDVADRIDATHMDGGSGWDTNTDTIRAYADEAR